MTKRAQPSVEVSRDGTVIVRPNAGTDMAHASDIIQENQADDADAEAIALGLPTQDKRELLTRGCAD